MWSIHYNLEAEEAGGICGAALTGQILSDA
jgi:hypothetical protein